MHECISEVCLLFCGSFTLGCVCEGLSVENRKQGGTEGCPGTIPPSCAGHGDKEWFVARGRCATHRHISLLAHTARLHAVLVTSANYL